MVEEATDILHRLSHIPTKLGCSVPEYMDAGGSNACLAEVTLEVAVEGPAG